MLLCVLCVFAEKGFSQKQTYDLVNYTLPPLWKKELHANGLQLSTGDEKKGTYAIILIFKATTSAGTANLDFNNSWDSLVKGTVTVSTAPEMMPAATEAGWEILTGMAPFADGENKGVALQITATGYDKKCVVIIMTNTDAYQKGIDDFTTSLSLKKTTAKPTVPNKTAPATNTKKEVAVSTKNTGYQFSTTNFDDGWTSTVQEDWVEVTKGNLKVLIHYPNKNADAYNSVLLDGLKHAWDILVAPRYSSAANMEFKSSGSWESIEFAEADMVEKTTGKTVYVVVFKKNFSSGSGKYIEFITPDKKTFEQEFGTYENASANYGSGSGFDKMINMVNYNKFAVAASDLKGKWTSNFTGMTQYVNAYTGASAGANTHASNENFEFGTGNTYKWDLGVASGFVGNIKFQSVKSTGKFTVVNNWQVKFSDIEGKPKTYNVQFVCIKGARVLWIGETGFGKKE